MNCTLELPCRFVISITLLLLSHVYALLCLSITLLLLSHVPCFVSNASRCTAISCRSYSHVPSFVSVLLSQVLCFVSASLDAVLALSHVPNFRPCYCSCSCALLCLNITPLKLRCLRVSRCSCSLCALLCPAQHHDALSSASPQHHAAHVPCLVSA